MTTFTLMVSERQCFSDASFVSHLASLELSSIVARPSFCEMHAIDAVPSGDRSVLARLEKTEDGSLGLSAVATVVITPLRDSI